MRLFLQAPSDGLVINHHITVTVESIQGDEVCLSIDAPPWVQIAAKPHGTPAGCNLAAEESLSLRLANSAAS